MYSETWLHEDGFEEKSLADIKAYIHETRAHGLILGDKYISHDLVPSFYLADEQTPVEQNRCAMACQGCGAVGKPHCL